MNYHAEDAFSILHMTTLWFYIKEEYVLFIFIVLTNNIPSLLSTFDQCNSINISKLINNRNYLYQYILFIYIFDLESLLFRNS